MADKLRAEALTEHARSPLKWLTESFVDKPITSRCRRNRTIRRQTICNPDAAYPMNRGATLRCNRAGYDTNRPILFLQSDDLGCPFPVIPEMVNP